MPCTLKCTDNLGKVSVTYTTALSDCETNYVHIIVS